MDMLEITQGIAIPMSEIKFSFVRSSGPGGQNVNKLNTKAVLRWDLRHSPHLPESLRVRFEETFPRRLTTEGELILVGQRFRESGRNQADCLEKLRAMLFQVAFPPKPRKPTRPTRGSQERRLRDKRARSTRKDGRRSTANSSREE